MLEIIEKSHNLMYFCELYKEKDIFSENGS